MNPRSNFSQVMASREVSLNRSYSRCKRCRKSKKRCELSEFKPRSCVNCNEANLVCSLSASRTTIPSRDAKRKVKEIGDTPDREDSTRSNRATSSVTAPYDSYIEPIIPTENDPQYGKQARPDVHSRILPATKKRKISVGACGLCLKKTCSIWGKRGDVKWLLCDIEGCGIWYHLSCVVFNVGEEQVFYSFRRGVREAVFTCPNCLNHERDDLADAVDQAISTFEASIARINRIASTGKAASPETCIDSPPQEQLEATHTSLQNVETLDVVEEPRPPYFERAREEKFEGYQTEKIKSLLKDIGEVVYDHDREICHAKGLFHDGSDVSFEHPLRVWDQIDHGHYFVSGKEWFNVDGEANNLSESHAPITAALRQMLGTPDDKPLHIGNELKDLSFSQVHTALINWFVFDILKNELNLYQFPNMKPLRATMIAVANFGDARWKGSGRQVLREVQLRAWHKEQFREEVTENVGWQGELIRRLDHFLKPLTRKIGNIDPWSPTRASIIKHTIELWTYLEASVGKLEIIQPPIGGSFDGGVYENVGTVLRSCRPQDMEVKWVTRRGFRFNEDCVDGSERPFKENAIVVVK